jgi:hypothetical protein
VCIGGRRIARDCSQVCFRFFKPGATQKLHIHSAERVEINCLGLPDQQAVFNFADTEQLHQQHTQDVPAPATVHYPQALQPVAAADRRAALDRAERLAATAAARLASAPQPFSASRARAPRSQPYLDAAVQPVRAVALKAADRIAIERAAEHLELNTKKTGQRDGAVSQSGLRLLRALLYKFANYDTGHCFPSYAAIRQQTGLCKETINNAIHRLETCGFLDVARRLVRATVSRKCHLTGNIQTFVTTKQGSNLYRFNLPTNLAEIADRWHGQPFAPIRNRARHFARQHANALARVNRRNANRVKVLASGSGERGETNIDSQPSNRPTPRSAYVDFPSAAQALSPMLQDRKTTFTIDAMDGPTLADILERRI